MTLDTGRLCRMDATLVRRLEDPHAAVGILARAALTVTAGTAAYGFTFGLWRAPLQGLISAIKLPLLFFAVVAVCSVIDTLLALALGARLAWRQVCAIILLSMAVAAALMGSLAPVGAFLALQLPPAGGELVGLAETEPAVLPFMRAYWGLLLFHVAVIGACGVAGSWRLYVCLKRLVPARAVAVRVLLAWMVVSGFAGSEIAWMLSPFLCKPTQAPHILPREYGQENFYERVWRAARGALRSETTIRSRP